MEIRILKENQTIRYAAEELKKYISVKKIYVPFADVWPEEETAVGALRVKALWGRLLNREKKLWQNRGYSGKQDSLSYQIEGKGFSFTTAGNNRFLLQAEQRTDNIRNGTKKLVF